MLAAALDTKLAVVDAPTVTLYVSSAEPVYVPDTDRDAVDPLLHKPADTDAADAADAFTAAPDTNELVVDAPTVTLYVSSTEPVYVPDTDRDAVDPLLHKPADTDAADAADAFTAAPDTNELVVDAPTVTLYVSSTEPVYVPDTDRDAVDPLLHKPADTDAEPAFTAAPDTNVVLVVAPTLKVQRSSVVPV